MSAPASGDLVLVRTTSGWNFLLAALAFLIPAGDAPAVFLKAALWFRFLRAVDVSDGVDFRRLRGSVLAAILSGGDAGDSGGDEYLGRCWATWMES